jgi:hypothetical protein
MAGLARSKIANLLQVGLNGASTNEKGRALEDVVCYIFEKVPGISVTKRNVRNVFDTEEVDVAFFNERRPKGFIFLPQIILVECKNWSGAVGSVEVAWFNEKLRSRGLTFGILVAANGITGDVKRKTDAHAIIAGALREQRNIIVLTSNELRDLRNSDDLIQLIKEKLCELAVEGTVFA